MTEDVAIVGVGIHPFGRHEGVTGLQMAAVAARRALVDAGDTEGWAHHVVWTSTDGDVEFALGETRWDESGERIGTFLAVGQLDGDGRMRRYMVARTPALGFPSTAVEASDAGSA